MVVIMNVKKSIKKAIKDKKRAMRKKYIERLGCVSHENPFYAIVKKPKCRGLDGTMK
jgi:hypothetical protein